MWGSFYRYPPWEAGPVSATIDACCRGVYRCRDPEGEGRLGMGRMHGRQSAEMQRAGTYGKLHPCKWVFSDHLTAILVGE